MRTLTLMLLAVMGLGACTSTHDPGKLMGSEEQAAFLQRVAPYIAPPPENVKGAERLDPKYAGYFAERAKDMELVSLEVNDKDTARFMVYRIAPSNTLKKIAVAGVCYPAHGSEDFAYYSEAFWTWKMEPDRLEERAPELFGAFVNGRDLSPYEENDPNFGWIEFPNADTEFNPETRTWVRGMQGE